MMTEGWASVLEAVREGGPDALDFYSNEEIAAEILRLGKAAGIEEDA